MKSGADHQERIIETFLVQNDGFIKVWGQDPGLLPWAWEGWLIMYLGAGMVWRVGEAVRGVVGAEFASRAERDESPEVTKEIV